MYGTRSSFPQIESDTVSSRTLCEHIYRPPIVPPDTPIRNLALRHGLDYRTTFLEEKRVRYDGVYISVCHYM